MLKVSRQEPIGLYCQTGESLFTFRRFFYSSFVAYTEVESIQRESSKLQLHAVLHFWNVSFFSYKCRLRKKCALQKKITGVTKDILTDLAIFGFLARIASVFIPKVRRFRLCNTALELSLSCRIGRRQSSVN